MFQILCDRCLNEIVDLTLAIITCLLDILLDILQKYLNFVSFIVPEAEHGTQLFNFLSFDSLTLCGEFCGLNIIKFYYSIHKNHQKHDRVVK